MNGDIFLTIDRIVLQGMGQVDRHQLTTVLQQALSEQLVLRPELTSNDISRMRTNFTLPTDMNGNVGVEQLGQSLTHALCNIISNARTGITTRRQASNQREVANE